MRKNPRRILSPQRLPFRHPGSAITNLSNQNTSCNSAVSSFGFASTMTLQDSPFLKRLRLQLLPSVPAWYGNAFGSFSIVRENSPGPICQQRGETVARYTSGLVGVSVLLGLFFLALSFFGSVLVFIASLDHGTSDGLFALSEHDLVLLMRIYAIVCPLVGGTVALLMRLYRHISQRTVLMKFVAFTVSSSALLFILLTKLARERLFYPLGTILTAPETLEVFGRRLLLVWPARWMSLHAAGLSPLRAYYVTQAAAICVTVSLIGIWSARFAGWRNAYLGQLLLIVMVCPTFLYHNYYDIFIIATFTGALLCLVGPALFALLFDCGYRHAEPREHTDSRVCRVGGVLPARDTTESCGGRGWHARGVACSQGRDQRCRSYARFLPLPGNHEPMDTGPSTPGNVVLARRVVADVSLYRVRLERGVSAAAQERIISASAAARRDVSVRYVRRTTAI